MWIPIAVFFAMCIVMLVVGMVASKAKERNDHRSRKAQLTLLRKMVDKEERVVERLREAQRLNTIAALIKGKKCRGCSKVVKADDLEEVGEDPNGRPVELCSGCRGLAS